MTDPTEVANFLDLVRRMRAKQIEYFRARNQQVLSESKDLERRVDAVLKRDAAGPGLFEGESHDAG